MCWGPAAGAATALAIVLGCAQLRNLLPAATFPHFGTVAVELIATGFTTPLGLAVPRDGTGRKFIVDQVGRVMILDANDQLLPTPFLDLTAVISQLSLGAFDERGLLGLAFHPDYENNGRFFVAYNAPKDAGDPADFDSELRISEFAVMAGDANLADPNSEQVLLDINKPQGNHNGGQVEFGPDGYLYISIGDGGGAGDIGVGHTAGLGNAQDKSVLLGKILRIDVDSGNPYVIPADNPFVGDPGAQGEIWALGFRNPWRFSFDSGGANRLFVGDVGQDLFEEVNIVARGGNHGWNIREGNSCYNTANPPAPLGNCADIDADGDPLIAPIIVYPHVQNGLTLGLSVTGGYVYRGAAIPDLIGRYVFADWSSSFVFPNGRLLGAEELADGTWEFGELRITGLPDNKISQFIHALGRDEDGELYILCGAQFSPTSNTGRVYRIVPVP